MASLNLRPLKEDKGAGLLYMNPGKLKFSSSVQGLWTSRVQSGVAKGAMRGLKVVRKRAGWGGNEEGGKVGTKLVAG